MSLRWIRPFALAVTCMSVTVVADDSPIQLSPTLMTETLLKSELADLVDTPPKLLLSLVEGAKHRSKTPIASEKARLLRIGAFAHIGLKQYRQAKDKLAEALAENRDDFESRWLLARCLAELNEHDEAARECLVNLELQPKHIPTQLTLVAVYLGQDDIKRAQQVFSEISSQEYDVREAYWYYLNAILSYKIGDYENSLRYARTATSAPFRFFRLNASGIWGLQAAIYVKLDDFDSAQVAATRTLECDPENVQTLQLLWKIHRKKRRYITAFGIARKMMSAQPNELTPKTFVALSALDLKQIRYAASVVNQILRIDPDHQVGKKLSERIRRVAQGKGKPAPLL